MTTQHLSVLKWTSITRIHKWSDFNNFKTTFWSLENFITYEYQWNRAARANKLHHHSHHLSAVFCTDLVWYVMDMLIIYLKSLTLMFSSLVYVLLRKSVASWKKLPTYLVELDFNASSLCSFLESCDYYFYVFGWNKTYCCSTITARHIYSTWYQAGLKW